MTATLTIIFNDFTTKEIIISKAIEMTVSQPRRQSIEFRETTSGEWVMAFTSQVMEGKKFKTIEIRKDTEQ